MQYLVTGYDGTDEKAMERRLAVREKHMEGVNKLKNEKKHLFAAAILDENERMVGSVLIVDFPTREELDKWLEVEPYVVGKVWEKIEIVPCKVPQMFMALHK